MKEIFRTTLRLDLNKPDERQAADLLKSVSEEQNLSYSALIVSAINARYGDSLEKHQPFSDEQCEFIRAIVREELGASPFSLGSLLQAMNQQAQLTPVAEKENNEPDEDDLDAIFDSFGC